MRFTNLAHSVHCEHENFWVFLPNSKMLYLNDKTSNLKFFIILIVSIATNKFMAILKIRWPFKMYSNAAIS